MASQLTFEELCRARAADPATSKAAARRAGGLASEHQRKILEVLAAGGDWTPCEIAAQCGLSSLQVSRRMHELWKGQQIAESGVLRKTPAGRPARAWRIAP